MSGKKPWERGYALDQMPARLPPREKAQGAGLPSSRRLRALVAAAAFASAALASAAADADASLEGRWKQGPLREDFTVRQWLPGCGPEPQSGSAGGGEIVSVRLEGDELAFVGGGRVFRTNQCYDAMPNLTRETHSRDPSGRTWRTRCTTPSNDPRRAILNTLVVATTDRRIDLVETGRYEVALANGTCMADVKRTRSFDLVVEDPPAAPASAAPAPAPAPKEPTRPAASCEPGEPSRLEVRPSKKLLRTGETFQFRSLVLDDKACPTRTPTSWQLAPGADGKGVSVDERGTVSVAEDAPEGSVELVATAAGKSTRVTVEVSQPAHYAELLARSGLNASGENDAASVVTIGSQSLGVGEGRVEDRARTRRLLFVGLVGGALVILGAVALALLRRSRRAAALEREAEERHEARVQEVLRRRKARAEAHAAQQRAHEESVAAATRDDAEEERTCGTCGKSFPAGTAFCPHDGAPLAAGGGARAGAALPYVAPEVAHAAKRGKICPTCGEHFDGGAEFCGKDGTQLVLLN